MNNKEVLIKLASILAKQQRILKKMAQPAPPTGSSSSSPSFEEVVKSEQAKYNPKGTMYLDPNSDTASDLRESVSALTEPEPEYEEDETPSQPDRYGPESRGLVEKGMKLLDEADAGYLKELPPEEFDKKFNHYLKQKNSGDHFYRENISQLSHLAMRDLRTWGEIGEYFPGWGSGDIGRLVKRLESS